MKNLSFKAFMNARSKYFFGFFEAPHWIGMIAYLLFGMSYGAQPGGSVMEGIGLAIIVICLMYYFWKKANLKK